MSRRLLLVSVGGLSWLAGCTHTAPVEPADSQGAAIRPPPGPRLPLGVGIYLDAQTSGYEQRLALPGGHRGILPIGAALATQLEGVCAQRFARSARLRTPPPLATADADGLDFVIEPRLEQASITQPPMLAYIGQWEVSLDVSFDISTPAGEPVSSGRVSGAGTNDRGVDWSGPGVGSAGNALANAAWAASHGFAIQFPRWPGVAERLRARGITLS